MRAAAERGARGDVRELWEEGHLKGQSAYSHSRDKGVFMFVFICIYVTVTVPCDCAVVQHVHPLFWINIIVIIID